MGAFRWGIVACALVVPNVAQAERVVYLNAEPTLLNSDNANDPTTDSYSSTGFTPGMITGWPALTAEQKDEVLHLMREASVPFDITFTWDRPASGTYDMIVFGTDIDKNTLFATSPGCSTAIGLADCDDGNAENIGFMFYGCMTDPEQMDMRRVAFNAYTALGFGWGLEQLQVNGQIMGTWSAMALRFGDACIALTTTPALCTHQVCTAGQQNPTEDLNFLIGARVDDGPPMVTITSPGDMEVVDGAAVTVTADILDKFGGLSASLEIVEVMQQLDDTEPPWSWNLTDIPDGQWTLRVTGTDADNGQMADEVVICVGAAGCGMAGESGAESTGNDDNADGTTGPGPSTTSGGDTGPIDPTNPPSDDGGGFGPAAPSKGCHCRGAPGTAPTMLLLLGVFGLGVGRRRRSVTP